MSDPALTLFVGVDRAAFAAAFADRVRSSGLDAPLSATTRFVAGLDAVGPMGLDDLYWLARLSFVTRVEQLSRFDRLFAAVFEAEMGRAPARRSAPAPSARAEDDRLHAVRSRRPAGAAEPGAGLPWATLPSVVSSAEDGDDTPLLPELLAAAAPALADKPFDELDEDEMRVVAAVLDGALVRWPRRRTRRVRHATRGRRVAFRPTMRRALRTGGEPVDLVRLRSRTRPRAVVALVDVSGSMESVARGYLHVMRALAVAERAEVFAFSTSLTKITPALRHHSAIEAIERSSALVGDRFGGTRLASSIGALLANRVWASHLRGAVVVVVSDGCDTDPPDVLQARMARLRRLAHRVVWVNPRLAADGYEPLVSGMQAVLPYCDRVLPGNTLSAIDDVIAAITDGQR